MFPNQNGSNVQQLLNQLGGIDGIRNSLPEFSERFAQQTNRTPQDIGMELQRSNPQQFQQFAAIADMIVGRRN